MAENSTECQVSFDPKATEILDKIKEISGIKTRKEVIVHAVALCKLLWEEQGAGARILLERCNKNEVDEVVLEKVR